MMARTERSAPEKIELNVDYGGGLKANKEHSWTWLLCGKRGLVQKGIGISESKHAVLLARADRKAPRKVERNGGDHCNTVPKKNRDSWIWQL